MIRKALMVCVVLLYDDASAQIFCFLIWMTLCMLLMVYIRPYKDKYLNATELLSLSSIWLTIVLEKLNETGAKESSTVTWNALNVCVIALHIIFLVAVIFCLVIAVRKQCRLKSTTRRSWKTLKSSIHSESLMSRMRMLSNAHSSAEEGGISETRTPPARAIIDDDSDLPENDLPFPPPDMIDLPVTRTDDDGIEMMSSDRNKFPSMIAPSHPLAAQDDPLQSFEEQDELDDGDSHCLTEETPPASEESPESGNKRSMFKKQSIRRLDMDTGFSYYENTVTGETDWVSDDSGSASD